MLNQLDLKRIVLANDIKLFAKEIFENNLPSHTDIYFSSVLNNKRSLILAPRCSIKSTCLSIIYPVWRIVRDRNIRILLISNSFSLASQYIQLIERVLESEKLVSVFGLFKPIDAWDFKDSSFTVFRPRDMKDSTMSCAGILSSVVGKRVDLIILDDAISFEDSQSSEYCDKINNWILSEVFNTLEPKGEIVVIGTPQSRFDIYGILRELPGWHLVHLKAIEGDKLLWPEKWSKEVLEEKRREIGSVLFARNFLCELLSEDERYFPRSLLNSCLLEKRRFFSEQSYYVIGCDFSILTGHTAKKKQGDYTVYLVMEYDPLFEERQVIHIFRKRGLTVFQQIEALKNLARKYRPRKILLENNVFQDLYHQILTKITDLPVRGFKMTKKKWHPVEGIPYLKELLIQQKIFFIKEEIGEELVNIFLDELEVFPQGKHDDMVIALFLADKALKGSGVRPFVDRMSEGLQTSDFLYNEALSEEFSGVTFTGQSFPI